jgi:hypothetical protein
MARAVPQRRGLQLANNALYLMGESYAGGLARRHRSRARTLTAAQGSSFLN